MDSPTSRARYAAGPGRERGALGTRFSATSSSAAARIQPHPGQDWTGLDRANWRPAAVSRWWCVWAEARSPLLDLAGALRGAACPWIGRSPPVKKSSGSVFFRPDVDGRRRQRKETVVSVVQPLPDHPNLTSLRKQAKSLLAAWRSGGTPWPMPSW